MLRKILPNLEYLVRTPKQAYLRINPKYIFKPVEQRAFPRPSCDHNNYIFRNIHSQYKDMALGVYCA